MSHLALDLLYIGLLNWSFSVAFWSDLSPLHSSTYLYPGIVTLASLATIISSSFTATQIEIEHIHEYNQSSYTHYILI